MIGWKAPNPARQLLSAKRIPTSPRVLNGAAFCSLPQLFAVSSSHRNVHLSRQGMVSENHGIPTFRVSPTASRFSNGAVCFTCGHSWRE